MLMADVLRKVSISRVENGAAFDGANLCLFPTIFVDKGEDMSSQ